MRRRGLTGDDRLDLDVSVKMLTERKTIIDRENMSLGIVGRFFRTLFGDGGFHGRMNRALEKKYGVLVGSAFCIVRERGSEADRRLLVGIDGKPLPDLK